VRTLCIEKHRQKREREPGLVNGAGVFVVHSHVTLEDLKEREGEGGKGTRDWIVGESTKGCDDAMGW